MNSAPDKIAIFLALGIATSAIHANDKAATPPATNNHNHRSAVMVDKELREVIEKTGKEQQCEQRDIADLIMILEATALLLYGAMISAEDHSFAIGGNCIAEAIVKLSNAITHGKVLSEEHSAQIKRVLASMDETTHRDLFATVWQQVVKRKMDRPAHDGLEIIT